MKAVNHCVVCGSQRITKKIGAFAPFIAHRVLDYPILHVVINGAGMFPPLFTNSLRCQECDFVFSQIRFDNDEMARLYHDYRGDEYARIRDIYEPGYAAINPLIGDGAVEIENRQRSVDDFLRDAVDPATISTLLDYGGDKGQHIPTLFSHCRKFVYEISNVAPLAGIETVSDLDTVGAVDFVMCCHVQEHLPYPGETLAAIKRVCTRGTKVFLEVPLEMSLDDPLQESQVPSQFHEHINFFTPRSLYALATANGFKPLKLEVRNIETGWIQRTSLYLLAEPDWFRPATPA